MTNERTDEQTDSHQAMAHRTYRAVYTSSTVMCFAVKTRYLEARRYIPPMAVGRWHIDVATAVLPFRPLPAAIAVGLTSSMVFRISVLYSNRNRKVHRFELWIWDRQRCLMPPPPLTPEAY